MDSERFKLRQQAIAEMCRMLDEVEPVDLPTWSIWVLMVLVVLFQLPRLLLHILWAMTLSILGNCWGIFTAPLKAVFIMCNLMTLLGWFLREAVRRAKGKS